MAAGVSVAATASEWASQRQLTDGRRSDRAPNGVSGQSRGNWRCTLTARLRDALLFNLLGPVMLDDIQSRQPFRSLLLHSQHFASHMTREHVLRFHSADSWCLKCKRFFGRKSKNEHIQCEEKKWPMDEEMTPTTWMSSDQKARHSDWLRLRIPGIEGESQKDLNWRKIYKSLFPEAQVIPSPYHEDSAIATTTSADPQQHTLSQDPVEPNAESKAASSSTTKAQRDASLAGLLDPTISTHPQRAFEETEVGPGEFGFDGDENILGESQNHVPLPQSFPFMQEVINPEFASPFSSDIAPGDLANREATLPQLLSRPVVESERSTFSHGCQSTASTTTQWTNEETQLFSIDPRRLDSYGLYAESSSSLDSCDMKDHAEKQEGDEDGGEQEAEEGGVEIRGEI
ncbi:hypothetical protein PG996_006482 [Apiospora saccharicola]|uniref:Uncharacterized protein n=1 Tax=Apiospora saccharicola TaxID=335842 RepID=A0ABR1VPF2_9PEZI